MIFSSGIASCSSASAMTLARAIQQLAEGRLTREIGSQHEGVDEQADEIFRLDLVAPGDLGAHRNVRSAGIAMQQRDQSGIRQHEKRAAILTGDRSEPVRQVPVEQLRKDAPPSILALACAGNRSASRKTQRRRGRETNRRSPAQGIAGDHLVFAKRHSRRRRWGEAEDPGDAPRCKAEQMAPISRASRPIDQPSLTA